MLTVMLPMISNCRPVGPTNLHITSSTVAVCTWNRSWSLGNVDSITLISCFNTFRQAIVFRASTPRSVCAPGSLARTHTNTHCDHDLRVSMIRDSCDTRDDGANVMMAVTTVRSASDHVRVPYEYLRRK